MEKVNIAGIAIKSTKERKTGTWRSVRPEVDKEKCIKCGQCVMFCPEGCIKLNPKSTIDYDYCKGCLICVNVCPVKCIKAVEEECSERVCKEGKK